MNSFLRARFSEAPLAGAGGILVVTSELGGLRARRYISRQEFGVLCGRIAERRHGYSREEVSGW